MTAARKSRHLDFNHPCCRTHGTISTTDKEDEDDLDNEDEDDLASSHPSLAELTAKF